jgi:hypothetical protein
MNNFETAFNSFFEKTINLHTNYMNDNYPNNPIENMTYRTGKKYVKIMRNTSVFAFVDMTNGDVLKAASFRAPAKKARGNIFDASNGMSMMTPQGPQYLRG